MVTTASKIATAILATIAIVVEASQWSHGEREPHLRRLSRRDKNNSNNNNNLFHSGNGAFLDGTETVYDDFSLAWRFLGFYTDCNVCVDGDGDNNNNDQGNDQDNNEEFRSASECIEDGQDTVCRKYALWAAYVDEGYTGSTTEYQYYDRKHKRWDDSQCDKTNNDEEQRCVRMDCHDPFSKHFKLMGVYKDHNIEGFLENMIDYSGDCVWNDDEYKFMQAMNNNDNNNNNDDDDYDLDYWPPKKCTALPNHNNGSVRGYYDAIPTAGGNLEMAVYSDASCTTRYNEEKTNKDDINIDMVLGRSSGDLESWNRAMDAFKICQPCVSYDTLFLSNRNFQKRDGYNSNGDRYGNQQEDGDDNDDGNDDDDGNDFFVCQDNLQQDEPTNQCQVLLEGGEDSMTVATYRDILLAESQGSVTGIDLSSESRRGKLVMGEPFVKPNHKWLSILLLIGSIGYFFFSLTRLFEKDRSKNATKSKTTMKEPLVRQSGDGDGRNKKSSAATTAAVANTSRKTKDKRAAEKEQRKTQRKEQQKQQKKKSILKKSKYNNNDEDDGDSQESTHYSKFRL